MPSFVVLEFGEKSFLWVGWAHFDTNYQVTPTFVRLGRAVTTILAEFRGEMDLIKRNNFQMFFGMAIDNIAENTSTYLNLTLAKYVPSLV